MASGKGAVFEFDGIGSETQSLRGVRGQMLPEHAKTAPGILVRCFVHLV